MASNKKLSGKKAENTSHNEEKNKSLRSASEMSDVIEFIVNSIKTVISTTYHHIKTLEGKLSMLYT